jgi:hypothetical protein
MSQKSLFKFEVPPPLPEKLEFTITLGFLVEFIAIAPPLPPCDLHLTNCNVSQYFSSYTIHYPCYYLTHPVLKYPNPPLLPYKNITL